MTDGTDFFDFLTLWMYLLSPAAIFVLELTRSCQKSQVQVKEEGEEQSGAAAMIRQSGNILDIATAMCSRSNCGVGYLSTSIVSTHLGKAFVGRPTRAMLVLSRARCASIAMACTRLPGSTVPWSATTGSIPCGITIDAIPCSTTFVPSGLALVNVSHQRPSSMIYGSKLPYKVTGSAFLWLA